MKIVLAALALAIATLAYSNHHVTHQGAAPIPLCPPDAPDCTVTP
jgi:hypothetical protein